MTTSALAAGVHVTTADYSGDSNFSPSASAPLSQTVNLPASTISFSSGPNPSIFRQQVTFMATVTPSTATGTVTFYDGLSALGTAPLSFGSATLSTTVLVPGVHTITGSYSGDSNFGPSTSPPLLEIINRSQVRPLSSPVSILRSSASP